MTNWTKQQVLDYLKDPKWDNRVEHSECKPPLGRIILEEWLIDGEHMELSIENGRYVYLYCRDRSILCRMTINNLVWIALKSGMMSKEHMK